MKRLGLLCIIFLFPFNLLADSVNSPNIILNADTNRSTGAGAGNVSVTVNTITIAETTLPEYSSGSGKKITIKARPGFQFDSTSSISAQSSTIGINNLAVNVSATVTPSGSADETITFNLTSGTNTGVQDIIRVNGVKLKILSALGAAGPAQNTLQLTSSTAGGAFTNQGIVAANISKGALDHMVFSIQPGNEQAGDSIEPEIKFVDFGGNLITTDQRNVTLAIQTNPGAATLSGTTLKLTSGGVAKWIASDLLSIADPANGYVLRASHSGINFLSTDTVDSTPFNISAGNPGGMEFSVQPSNTTAGGDIILSVRLVDSLGNPVTTDGISITLDSATNPGGWPLLVDTSLTKQTVGGVASWGADDNLRILKAVDNYTLSASGLGEPITSSTFNLTAGSPATTRIIQGPSSTAINAAVSPAITVDLADEFGNRVNTNTGVTLSLANNNCGVTLSGNTATAVSGLATFNDLKFDKPCEAVQLFAKFTDGIAASAVGAASDDFNITAPDAFPIALKSAEVQKKLFKFQANGSFTVSKETEDDPTVNGASLTVTGTTGTVTYDLPKRSWKKQGNKGFEFSGKKCSSVKLTTNKISAVCESKTGTIQFPENEIDIKLSVGSGTERYCGNCGGSNVGSQSKKFKKKACTAPAGCF